MAIPSIRGLWPLACTILCMWACSTDQRQVGGNSAETGNPEIAGTLHLADGSPASLARVACVSASFHPTQTADSLPITIQADSLGRFQCKNLQEGVYSVEVYHENSGERLLLTRMAVDSTLRVEASLQVPGSLRIGVNRPEGDTVDLWIPGSLIMRRAVVWQGTLFVDSLPATLLDSLVLRSGSQQWSQTQIPIIAGEEKQWEAPPLRLRLQIPLPTTGAGWELDSALPAFPLLLRLSEDLFPFRWVHPQKGRLRLWSSDSTQELPYRVARWDSSTSSAQLWVLLDTLLPQSATQTLTFAWDEGLASTLEGVVFGAGYEAVWHMDDTSGTHLSDATGKWPGELFSALPQAGIVNRSLYFDGLISYASIPGSESGALDFAFLDTVALSVWLRLENPNTSRVVWSKGILHNYLKYQHPNGWIFEKILAGEPTMRYVYDIPQIDTNQWVRLTVQQWGSQVEFYYNDSLIDSTARRGPAMGPRTSDQPFQIARGLMPDTSNGNLSFRAGQYFQGWLDELWVSRRYLGPQWQKALYQNQRPDRPWPR